MYTIKHYVDSFKHLSNRFLSKDRDLISVIRILIFEPS